MEVMSYLSTSGGLAGDGMFSVIVIEDVSVLEVLWISWST